MNNPLNFLATLKLRTAVAITFAISFFYGAIYHYSPVITPENRISWDGYFEVSYNLAHGNGFVFDPGGHKVFHRPPLYIWILTPCAALPVPIWRIYIGAINAAGVAGVAALLLYYGRKIFGNRAACIGWLIVSLHPLILQNVRWAHSGFLQMFLYSAILVASWRIWSQWQNGSPLPMRRAIGYGALLVAGSLIHGTMLTHAALLLGLFGAMALWRRDGALFRFVAVSGITLCLLVAPWTWRNYKVTGAFLPVVGNMGMAYFAGNAQWGITEPGQQANEIRQQTEMRHIGFPREPEDTRVRFYGFRSFADEQFANAQAKRHMREHPGDFAKKIFLNSLDYYFPVVEFAIPGKGSALAELSFMKRMKIHDAKVMLLITAMNSVLLAMAWLGVFHLMRKRETFRVGAVAVLAWAAFALPYFPFLTGGIHQLYTFGTIPIMALLGGIGLIRPNVTLPTRAANTVESPEWQSVERRV